MRKFTYTALAAAAGALVLPAAAQAQDGLAEGAEVTIGASGGYHDLGVSGDNTDLEGFDLDDDGTIYGGFVAVDVPLGETLFVGAEANGHFGSGAIDHEYGASGRLGFRTAEGAKFYVRGGYQWVDIDLGNLTGLDPDELFDSGDGDGFDFDTTEGDYLVGVGAEAPFGPVVLRGNLDTIAFDTLRATAGVALRF